MLLAKGLEFGLWDQKFADSRCAGRGAAACVWGLGRVSGMCFLAACGLPVARGSAQPAATYVLLMQARPACCVARPSPPPSGSVPALHVFSCRAWRAMPAAAACCQPCPSGLACVPSSYAPLGHRFDLSLPAYSPALPFPGLCRKFTGSPVTSQPDVTELALHDGDEFVIVASDGLWDVMDSQEVVKLARRDLQRGRSPQVGQGGVGWGGRCFWLEAGKGRMAAVGDSGRALIEPAGHDSSVALCW